MRTIDINADVGERPEAIADGSEMALLRFISSANIACGGHAGDEESMHRLVDACLQERVAVGAHPGYADRERFGRVVIAMTEEEIQELVYTQILALEAIAKLQSTKLTHVKPHGALYNLAARDISTARGVAGGIARADRKLEVVGLAGSEALRQWRQMGLRTRGEAFADRRYEPDGSLRSRKHSDALITDPAEAAEQAMQIALHRRADTYGGAHVKIDAETICIHSDTPNTTEIARAVHEKLVGSGLTIAR
jgi:5-oxoprolinase (ATP-hydrolysing) subunit A